MCASERRKLPAPTITPRTPRSARGEEHDEADVPFLSGDAASGGLKLAEDESTGQCGSDCASLPSTEGHDTDAVAQQPAVAPAEEAEAAVAPTEKASALRQAAPEAVDTAAPRRKVTWGAAAEEEGRSRYGSKNETAKDLLLRLAQRPKARQSPGASAKPPPAAVQGSPSAPAPSKAIARFAAAGRKVASTVTAQRSAESPTEFFLRMLRPDKPALSGSLPAKVVVAESTPTRVRSSATTSTTRAARALAQRAAARAHARVARARQPSAKVEAPPSAYPIDPKIRVAAQRVIDRAVASCCPRLTPSATPARPVVGVDGGVSVAQNNDTHPLVKRSNHEGVAGAVSAGAVPAQRSAAIAVWSRAAAVVLVRRAVMRAVARESSSSSQDSNSSSDESSSTDGEAAPPVMPTRPKPAGLQWLRAKEVLHGIKARKIDEREVVTQALVAKVAQRRSSRQVDAAELTKIVETQPSSQRPAASDFLARIQARRSSRT